MSHAFKDSFPSEPARRRLAMVVAACLLILLAASSSLTAHAQDAPAELTISVTDATLAEGDTGERDMQFTVTLSGSPSHEVRLRATAWAKGVHDLAKGGKGPGRDFLMFKNRALIFAANATGPALSKTLTVTVLGDQVDETDETFTLLLNNLRTDDARVAFAGGKTKLEATGTITDDDAADTGHTISVTDAILAEGDAGERDMQFTVTLSGSPSHEVRLRATAWAKGVHDLAKGGKGPGRDFLMFKNRALIFAANATGPALSKTLTVTVLGDQVDETDETFTLLLNNLRTDDARVAFAGGKTKLEATGTITDDDERLAPPAPPTNLTATSSPFRSGYRLVYVRLAWTPPADPVAGYEYQYKRASDANWSAWTTIPNSASATAYIVARLKDRPLSAGATYEFRLRAVNDAGNGAESPAVSVTVLHNVPAAPTNLHAEAGPDRVKLSWTAPPGPITDYQIQYIKNNLDTGEWGNWSDWISVGNTTTYTMEPLHAGATYQFVVRALDGHIIGAESKLASAIPIAAAPTDLTATAGPGWVRLTWTAPAGTIRSYEIRHKQTTDAAWGGWISVAKTTTHTLQSLRGGSQYQFAVRAVNIGGAGAVSATVSASPTLTTSLTPCTLGSGSRCPRTIAKTDGRLDVAFASGDASLLAPRRWITTLTESGWEIQVLTPWAGSNRVRDPRTGIWRWVPYFKTGTVVLTITHTAPDGTETAYTLVVNVI